MSMIRRSTIDELRELRESDKIKYKEDNMSAKEMFEELGYTKSTELDSDDEPRCIYYNYSKNNYSNCEKITFQCYKNCVMYEYNRPLIDMKINKAIQKQIKELGWESDK